MNAGSVDPARILGLCVVLASAVGMAAADVVDVALVLVPPSAQANRVTVHIEAAGQSDSDTAELTGNIETRLWVDLDPVSHQPAVAALAFQGGRILVSDVEFSFYVFLLADIEGGTAGVSAAPSTTAPISLVTNGQFPGVDHLLTFDQGVLSYDGTVLGTHYADTVNLSADPMEITPRGPGNLEVSLLGLDGGLATYSVLLEMPVDFSEQVVEEPLAVTVTLDSGMMAASGMFTRQALLPGDADGDGDVDDGDLSLMLANWTGVGGEGKQWGQGDFDGNGGVSDADLSLLLANWTGSPGASVPEPASIGLLILISPLLLRRRAGSRSIGHGKTLHSR